MKQMIKNGFIIPILALALSLVLSAGINPTKADTLRKGAPVGTNVSSKIDVWDPTGSSEYGTNMVYDVELTVLRVVRGNEAWGLIEQTSKANKCPETGFEYLLAYVRIAFHPAENSSAPYTLNRDVFKVYDDSNHAYAYPDVLPPEPALIGSKFYPGDTHEGWITFLIFKNHKRPLMFFTGGLWFQLFYE